MFKFHLFLLWAAFAAATVQARSLLEHPHFEMEPGRKIYVEMRRASASDKPTFLFLPGLFCAPLLNEKFIQKIQEAGFGAIIMNFSTQAPSVNLLAKDETPAFNARNLSLEDLAQEIEFVAQMVRTEFPGIHIIPVSLSFSSVVTPFLKSFPHIIETSPMTSTWAATPQIRNMRSFLNLNPFLSRQAVRKMLDQTYFNAGWAIAEFTIHRYKLPRDRKYEMNEGYEAMMRMAEDFDLQRAAVDLNVRRDWILAGNEIPTLKIHQQRTIAKFQEIQAHSRLIVIKGAGHIIKDDQPEKLAEALIHLAPGCEDHVLL